MGTVRQPVKEFVLVQSSKWKELRDRSRKEPSNLPGSPSAMSESEDVSKPAKDVSVIKSESDINGVTDVKSSGEGEPDEAAARTAISAPEVVDKPKNQEANTLESAVVDSSAAVVDSSAAKATEGLIVPSSVLSSTDATTKQKSSRQSKKRKRSSSLDISDTNKPVFKPWQRARIIKHWIQA